MVQALVTSRLDYVNILYLGLPKCLLNRLQVAQNAAARMVLMLKPRTHIPAPQVTTVAASKKED